MARAPVNLPASIHQRLLNRAKREDRPLQELLQYYAIERFLFRLGESVHARNLLLKGAMMLRVWDSPLARPTLDVDLLARGIAASVPAIIGIVRDCCAQAVAEDGVRFDPDGVRGEAIRLDATYQAVRVHFFAQIGKMRIPMKVDVGTGDAVVPAPLPIEFPTLLDQPAPRLLAYPPETAVAEKFQAMVELDVANSRMKDFYDIWTLAQRRPFEGAILAKAMEATFGRRQTPLPTELPIALTPRFAADPAKQTQWSAFVRKGRLHPETGTLADIVAVIRDFLMPPVLAAASGAVFDRTWPAGGPWRPNRGGGEP